MKDSVGSSVNINDLIAFNGEGNGDDQYGIVVALVTKVDDKKISIRRLGVKYHFDPINKSSKPEFYIINSTRYCGDFVVITTFNEEIIKIRRWLSLEILDSEIPKFVVWFNTGILK